MSVTYVQRVTQYPFFARLAALLALVLFMRWLWVTDHIANGPVLCPFRLITGHTCPMCGSTRAVAALCAGDISAAWNLNPIGTVMATLGGIGVLGPIWIRSVMDRLRVHSLAALKPVGMVLMATSFLAIWIWNLSRW